MNLKTFCRRSRLRAGRMALPVAELRRNYYCFFLTLGANSEIEYRSGSRWVPASAESRESIGEARERLLAAIAGKVIRVRVKRGGKVDKRRVRVPLALAA